MGIEDFHFKILTSECTINPFKSKDNDLNAFLYDDAKKYLEDLLAVTYILEDLTNNKTVAYFSVLNDKIVFDPDQRSIWNRLNRKVANAKRKKSYPSVKIGRLAVSKEYEGMGIGRDIIRLVKYMFTHGNRTGCRFITVDAYCDAVDFYHKCGFEFITEKDKGDKTRLMYYDLKQFK